MHVAAILKLKGRTVVTTTADRSMLDVAKLLAQHSIGCIVIEGDDGKVAGIVSERDLMRAIGRSGAKVLKEPVSVYMTKRVVTAREADTIDRLMSEMTVHRFRHMPVVERGRLIGLVSIGDVVKMHIAQADMEWARRRRGSTQPSLVFLTKHPGLRLVARWRMNAKNPKPNLRSEKIQSTSFLIWIISGLYLLPMVWFLLLSPMGGYGTQEAQPWLVPAVVVFTVSYGILSLLLWPHEKASFEGRPERLVP